MTLMDFWLENYGMTYELLGLVVLLLISAHVSKGMKVKTTLVIFFLALEMVFFNLEKWTQTFDHLSIFRPLLTAAVYSVYPIILIIMMQIITTNLSRKRFWILMIPELICVPLFFSSQWTRLVFYFVKPNNYAGGPLTDLPYYLFAFYAAVFLIHNIVYLRDYPVKHRMIVIYIIVGPFLGVVMQLLYHSDKDYSSLFTSGTVLYFIYLYIFLSRIDTMTSLLNRQSFYQDVEFYAKAISAVVSVDMNDLKYLNDNYGHDAGDKALREIGRIMLENSGPSGTAYRVGGDEFVILYNGVGESEVNEYISVMRQKINEASYVCAFGYAMRSQNEPVFDAVKRSDLEMYTDKARLKKLKKEQEQKPEPKQEQEPAP